MTISLEEELVNRAREVSGDNFSRFVSDLIAEYLEERERRRLREELKAGYLEEAETDLELVEDFQHVDRETAARYEA